MVSISLTPSSFLSYCHPAPHSLLEVSQTRTFPPQASAPAAPLAGVLALPQMPTQVFFSKVF